MIDQIWWGCCFLWSARPSHQECHHGWQGEILHHLRNFPLPSSQRGTLQKHHRKFLTARQTMWGSPLLLHHVWGKLIMWCRYDSSKHTCANWTHLYQLSIEIVNFFISHRIHAWYIFLHLPLKSTIHGSENIQSSHGSVMGSCTNLECWRASWIRTSPQHHNEVVVSVWRGVLVGWIKL